MNLLIMLTILKDLQLPEVVRSLVLFHLHYNSSNYLRWLKKTRTKVQKIFNVAARLAPRCDRYVNCEEMMRTLGYLNMENQYKHQLLTSSRMMRTSSDHILHELEGMIQ